jgi:transposase-like protein
MTPKTTRRKFSADFKAKVVIEALKERSTIEELSRKFELHPNQISTWKKEFLNNASAAFASESDNSEDKKAQEEAVDKLYSQIGKLKVENDFLKKKLL